MELLRGSRNFESYFPSRTLKLADDLWRNMDIGSVPIELPLESSYGLPILIGLREVNNTSRVTGHPQHGYVIGLFEDRRKLAPSQTLDTLITDPKIRMDFQYKLNPSDEPSTFKLPNTKVEAVEPLGWRVMEKRGYQDDGLIAHVSSVIGNGREIMFTSLKEDPYFLNFSKVHDVNAITVGFEQTFQERRSIALAKYPDEIRQSFKDYSRFSNIQEEDFKRFIKLQQRVHIKKGLGTLLTDLSLILSKKLGYSKLYIEVASEEAEALLNSYRKARKIKINKLGKENDSYVIVLP